MEKKFTTVNGRKVCYWEGGSGETLPRRLASIRRSGQAGLLLLHAWGRPWLETDKALYLLAEKFRVIAPIFPGYGESEPFEGPHTIEAYKDFTFDFIRKLKLRETHIAGLSMGSLVALTAAAEKPHHFKKLILIGFSDNFARDFPLGREKGSTALLKCLKNPSACRLLSGKVGGLSKPVIAVWEAVAGAAGTKDFCVNIPKLIKELGKTESRAMLENATDFLCNSYEDRVRELTIPTAVICGEKDCFVIPKKCETPTGRCPRFERIVIRGGKHLIVSHRPKELTEAITGFILG